ncbi:pyrroline-5-carboxylate reductase [Novosphingobium piscinae]|uniref:Pyrroline-5-carboxylate reductase n=1 Tax=Novosphingobium piscinae TaxID=1507448 RepID=A0A7X1KP97_9SPHN|nr:pyrroline-5-carboxylate reductase [Novosphingobium piscinae]MBC2668263.1 pyrroline-5-carboxylate reductase [Novosphingobium piscinae]
MRLLQLGCGNMGGAMLAGWLAGGMPATSFTVVDPQLAAAPDGVRLLRSAPADEAPFDMLLLGFKPQQFAAIAPGLEPLAGEGTVVLSILAGVELATLRARFPRARGIVRVMPNLAVALGKSPIGLVGEVSAADRAAVDRLMAPLGQAEWLVDEQTMHLVTALAGSGPAFVYRVIDALAGGAAALGLPRDQADRLALAMVEGAAALAAASEHSPGNLADRVASPGGTTRAGMNVLDAEDRLLALMTDTLRAAHDRSVEMSEEARTAG